MRIYIQQDLMLLLKMLKERKLLIKERLKVIKRINDLIEQKN
jgi:hypothetical protein